jgi:hypothetical protein
MFRVILIGASCALLSLTACSQLKDVSALNINDQVLADRSAACRSSNSDPARAEAYMERGFADVLASCELFFVQATKAQQSALAANHTLDAGLVGMSSILGVTSSPAAAVKAISVTTAAVVFGKALANDYVTIFTFGTHLSKVRTLVYSDMDNYKNSIYNTPSRRPTNICSAYARVQEFATKCTLANMQSLLDAQVALPSAAAPPVVAAVANNSSAAKVLASSPMKSSPNTPPPLSSTVVPLTAR